MNFDQFRVPAQQEVRLGLGRPAFFMVLEADKPTFNPKRNVRSLVLGPCKKATIRMEGDQAQFDFTGVVDVDMMTRKLRYLYSTPHSLGLMVDRVKGKSSLVALLLTDEAGDDAVSAFAEMDEDYADEDADEDVSAYLVRDRATGEEITMLDPPGGAFRDLGNDWRPSEETGHRLRDRRNGVWVNGHNTVWRPEGLRRQAMLQIVQGNLLVVNVPPLGRSYLFSDGYEVIEEGSQDGWAIWQWCEANATGDWTWINLAPDGGPWLEMSSTEDLADLLLAFPDLADLNPELRDRINGEDEA